MRTAAQDQPTHFPAAQVNGAPLKSITRVILERRATSHFKPDAVPDEYVHAILQFAAQAPSGFNLQPWRFVVVRQEKNRRRLQMAAMNQPKIGEAPVVVIAFAVKGGWRTQMDPIFREAVERGSTREEQIANSKKMAADFLERLPSALWLNRHTMIAVTTMMLVAEAYGLDTAPMEEFDAEAVKREFALPSEAEVVALLAIGFAQEPDKTYPGRLPLGDLVYEESYKNPRTEQI